MGVGLYSLAVRHYERALQIVEDKLKANSEVRSLRFH